MSWTGYHSRTDFIFYWESWDGWPKILQSRYCHIGYTIIYYLERRKPG